MWIYSKERPVLKDCFYRLDSRCESNKDCGSDFSNKPSGSRNGTLFSRVWKRGIGAALAFLIFLSPPAFGHSNPVWKATSYLASQDSSEGTSSRSAEVQELPDQGKKGEEQFNRGTLVGKETHERERAAQKARARNWLIAIVTVALGIATLVLVSKHHHNK